MPKTPLENVAQLRAYHRALKGLGYRTVEQFVGAAHASRDSLSRYLGTDVEALLATLPVHHAPLMAAARAYAAKPRLFPLGVALHRIPRPANAFAISLAPAGPPVAQVNMVAQMPPIRDQGDRGTCVAFASLAVVEHYQGLQNAYQQMSEQFLYWDCKANDGDPNGYGTWLSVAFPRLQSDGCCLDSTWPYNPNVIPGNEGQGPPPAAATAQAPNYKVATINALPPTSVQDIKNELQRGRCVAFSIPVFNSWYQNNEVTLTGDIVLPIPNEPNVGGHAMCIVGYNDAPTDVDLGGGTFIVRNSWNSQWGTQCVYGVGYGTIPYAYIARFATEAYSIY